MFRETWLWVIARGCWPIGGAPVNRRTDLQPSRPAWRAAA